MDPDHGAVRCGARGCSAPPRPRPDSEPRARQLRGQTRRVGAPEPRESCGGLGRPYCRCGAGTGTEDGGAGAETGRPVGPAPTPRCRGAGRGRAAPTPLSSHPTPQRGRDKAPPAERPRGAGLCLPGPRSGRAPARCRCGARSLPVPYLLARRGARHGLPARSIVLPAALRGPAGRREGRGAAGPPPCLRLKATAAQDPLRRPSAPPRPRRDRPGVLAPSPRGHVSAFCPMAPTPIPGVPQRPPRCPQSPQSTIHIPKHNTNNLQSTPQCDTGGHFSALGLDPVPPKLPCSLSPQEPPPRCGSHFGVPGQLLPATPALTPGKDTYAGPPLPFTDQYFFLFSLSCITARSILQGRVLTGIVTPETISPAWPQRAERVNCSIGKIDQTQQAGK